MNTKQSQDQQTNKIANAVHAFAAKRGIETTIRARQNAERRALVPTEEECVNDHVRDYLYPTMDARASSLVPMLMRA